MTKSIILYSGEGCLVDDEDYEKFSKYKYALNSHGYAVRYRSKKECGKYGQTSIHREILGILGEKGVEVDHINHNKLDNRKSNLRLCTRQENQRNRRKGKTNKSGYKGVHKTKGSPKWRATVYNKRKLIYLGMFENIIDAAKAYDEAAREIYGEFANLNFK